MASQGYSNPTSRNSSSASTLPAKIEPKTENKMASDDSAIKPTARAKNVSMGNDSGSSLSIKDGKC